MKTKKINSLQELKEISYDLAKDFKIPQLVLLEGPLAVGKTQMIKYMLTALDYPKQDVCSPTFSLINMYKKGTQEIAYHIDFYRMKNQKDIESTSFWDIFYEPSIVFIEWPQLVYDKLPPSWRKLVINLSFDNKKISRILKYGNLKN